MQRSLAACSLALIISCGTMTGVPGLPGGTAEMEMRGFPDETLELEQGGYNTRQRLVVRTEEEWQDVWAGLYPNDLSRPPRPSVDFAEEMVIVAAMGTQASNGYAIHIDGVRDLNGDIWVFVREVSPSLTCDRTPIATRPAAAVRVDRRDGGATFVERGETTVCD